MSDEPPSSELTLREGTAADWAELSGLFPRQRAAGSLVNAAVWAHWVESEASTPIVALRRGQIVGVANLRHLGPSEWWAEGVQLGAGVPEEVASALIEKLVALFRERGDGILRMGIAYQDERLQTAAQEMGFRHRATYQAYRAAAGPADFSPFRLLLEKNLSTVFQHLRSSPMYRANRYTEHYGTLAYLTEARLQSYLAAPAATPVLGWRQFDQLHGVAILALQPPPGRFFRRDQLYISYLAAPDDTTLTDMLTALCGLADHQQRTTVFWQMPLGVGLEGPIERTPYHPIPGEQIWLYELPLRALLKDDYRVEV